VPGSFVQPSGLPELELSEGRVVTLLPVRINASSKALTVEVCWPFYCVCEIVLVIQENLAPLHSFVPIR
jgi:hypothetical protein